MNKLQRTYVIYRFASDYHSGQWSRGYRLLSRCQKALRRYLPTSPINRWLTMQRWGQNHQRLYNRLVERYDEKL